MTITLLDPADAAAMGRWYDLMVAVTRHDLPDFPTPGRQDHAARFEHPWPGITEEALLVWDGDRVVGAASCSLPRAESLSAVRVELIVHPRHRRRGIGTKLLEEVGGVVRRHRRGVIEIEAVRDAAGFRYLTHRGHRPGVTSVRSRCRVTGRAQAWTTAVGYSLVQWHDAAPEEIVGDVAALQSLFAAEQQYDTGRLRAQEATERGRGHRSYSTAARHDATGRIVARTKLAFEAEDDAHARQRVTIVEPAHRGRRLGLMVKSANHAYAQEHEPALRVIDTWNAEENTHMRAVNALLGFRPVDCWPVFSLSVSAKGSTGM